MKYLWILSSLLLISCTPQTKNEFIDLEQKSHHQSEWKNTITIINVWASWCSSCRKEMPILSNFYQNFAQKNNIKIIGISLDDSQKTQDFIKKTPVQYPIWIYQGEDRLLWLNSLGNSNSVLPYTQITAPNCTTKKQFFGEIGTADLYQSINEIKQQCNIN